MNELKPEDVMRALKCWASGKPCQESCPMYELKCKKGVSCLRLTVNGALALLREKDAEIKRLNKEVDRLSQVVLYHDGQIADARAEAITEFAKELTSELIKGSIYPVFVKGAIERTEKKLKGEVL